MILLIVFFSAQAMAATFMPYHPLSRSAFEIGEGDNEAQARRDAMTNIPEGFQISLIFSSPFIDCNNSSFKTKCRFYQPLEPKNPRERASYQASIKRSQLFTSFTGYGNSIQEAEQDLLLKTGKKSISVFSENLTISCPRSFDGPGAEKCVNKREDANFIAEAGLPRICFLSE